MSCIIKICDFILWWVAMVKELTRLETVELSSDLKPCRIINGLWQVAGGHGIIDSNDAISEMIKYHNDGFTTWDMADIYGPSEVFFGEFRKN